MKKLLAALALLFSTTGARAADIVSNVEQALLITAEEYVREFVVPPNWSTLRLGVKLTTTLTATLTNSSMAIGLCSGTNSYGPGSATHFVGINFSGTNLYNNTGAFEYIGVNQRLIQSSASSGHANMAGKIVDGSVTTATYDTTSASASANFASGTATVIGFFIDFIKGSPWTIKLWWSATSADMTSAEMQTSMLLPTPLDGNGAACSYTTWTVSVDEASDGYLDSVDIYWSPATQSLRIQEIRVSRIQ